MDSRRVWAGVIAGVLAAMVLVGVAAGAYQAGQRHEVVTQVVGDGGGADVVRVVGNHGWGYGPGPGFFLFPLLLIVLVVLLLRGRRGGWGGGGWGGGCGPGPGPDAALQDWHRRAHGEVPSAPARAEGGEGGA